MILGQNFVYVVLEACWYIKQAERYYLILKVTVPSLKRSLLFILFTNPHLIVDTGQVKLYKTRGPT